MSTVEKQYFHTLAIFWQSKHLSIEPCQRHIFNDVFFCYLQIWHTWVRVLAINVTFQTISAVSSLSVLLVEESGVPGENNRPVVRH
jgi:hypothetical protein